jgi:hypothetical protein
MRQRSVSLALLVFAIGTASATLSAGSIVRPTLTTHRGNYFQWSAPQGWQEQETMSGVTLTAPDPTLTVSSVLLLRSRGRTSPQDFAVRILSFVPELSQLRVLSAKNQPPIQSGFGPAWAIQEIEMQYTIGRTPVRATWTVGIASAYGGYDAFMLGYQAPEEAFDAAKLWLAPIAQSVNCINPRQVAGNDTLVLPKNNPLDNSGLLKVWRDKGISEDRISQSRRAGMMGYERVKDTSTGRIYSMPLENWDGTVGGYRNPARPTEILQPTLPGE